MARRWGVPVLGLVLAVAAVVLASRGAAADPRDFTLHNNSSVTILNLYVQPSGPGDDWGDDVLGADVLVPGQSVLIYFTRFTEDNCFYDIRVVADDGSDTELIGQDLCSTTDITFS